jgi:adenosylhomocysteinase
VFAIKGESLKEYWDYTHRIFDWADGGTPNMILDDGGDATLLLHLGAAPRRMRRCSPSRQRGRNLPVRRHQGQAGQGPDLVQPQPGRHPGVTEETTTGVHRLYQMAQRASCCSRPSTSTTRSPRASSTTCTAAANRWWTASSAPPT